MSDPAGIGNRLNATLDQCIAAAVVAIENGDATITLPVLEWSRLVQDSARAVGYLRGWTG